MLAPELSFVPGARGFSVSVAIHHLLSPMRASSIYSLARAEARSDWDREARVRACSHRQAGVGTMSSFTGTQDKCAECDKTVHFIDLLTADGVTYHKTCFKCSHCKGILSVRRAVRASKCHVCMPWERRKKRPS
jgi:hypothetical protein